MAEQFVEREKEIINGNISPEAVIDYYDNWADHGYDEEVSPQVYRGPKITAETVASLFNISARDNTDILEIGAGTGLVATQVAICAISVPREATVEFNSYPYPIIPQ